MKVFKLENHSQNFKFLISFGIARAAKRTGIIFNTGLNDFGSKTMKNYFELPGSPGNYVAPNKRALTSMSPTIMVDNDGEVQLAIGAAGGTRITTGMASVWETRVKHSNATFFCCLHHLKLKLYAYYKNVGHRTNALVWTKHQRSGRCATNTSSTSTNGSEVWIWQYKGMIHWKSKQQLRQQQQQ